MQQLQIGRYQIHEELGRGAMGVVFRAVDSVIGRTVAIKTIRLDSFPDPVERDKLKNRLLREARSAGLLSHPNIVTVYDVGEEKGVAFIAMEYVQGQTLEQALRERGRLPPAQVLTILAEVAAALDYAHSKGVVHRDVKPGNLMLPEGGGGVKITDFGVAKLLSHQATQSDLMLGTPNYMAPEQIESGNVDGRADQFGMAVIAYELLTGDRPFHAETLSALLFRILREEPAAPHLLNSTLNDRVSGVLARALAKKAGDRFATCSALAKALTHSLAGCGNWQPLARAAAGTMATVAEPAVPAQPLPPAPAFTQVEEKPVGKRRPLLLMMATVAMAAAVAALWFWPEVAPVPAASETAPAISVDPSRPSPLAEPVQPPAPVASPVSTETAAVPATVKPSGAGGPVSGVVEIASEPSGATVSIDDTLDQCKTPCSMELSQGRHVLRFKLDKHRAGTLVIMVPQETSASIRLDPSIGTLMVLTTPAGAQILVNGQAQADRSPATLKLAPGKYNLTLRREGSGDHTQVVEVRDETITQVDFNWP